MNNNIYQGADGNIYLGDRIIMTKDAYEKNLQKQYDFYDPYYSSLLATDNANLQNTVQPTLANYESGLRELRQNELQDTYDFNTGEAQKGVFNSSGRMLRQNSLNAKYDNAYKSRYNTTKQAVQNALIRYGSQYGSGNTPSYSLSAMTQRTPASYTGGGLNVVPNLTNVSGVSGQLNAMDIERKTNAATKALQNTGYSNANALNPYSL
jgi:hypothetical protein